MSNLNELAEGIRAGEVDEVELWKALEQKARMIASGFPKDDRDDLVQECYIGMRKALDTWKPEKCDFTPHAIRNMRYAVLKYYRRTSILPDYVQTKVKAYKKFIHDYNLTHGRDPEDAEILTGLDISEDQLKTIRGASVKEAASSLDEELSDGRPFADLIPSECDVIERTEAAYDREILRSELSEALGVLDEKERFIICSNFEYDGCDYMTLDDIGDLYGVSGEAIRQMKSRALKKIFKCSQTEKLRHYYDEYFSSHNLYKNTGVGSWKKKGSPVEKAVIDAEASAANMVERFLNTRLARMGLA